MKSIFRAFLCAVILCLFNAIAFATTITVQSVQIPNWTRTSTAPTLRVFYDHSFTESTGTKVIASGSPASGVAYKVVTCTLLAGTVTIPSFDIHSTVDGIDYRLSRVSFYLYSGNTNLGAFGDYVNLKIPASLTSSSGCSPSGVCATFSDLKLYSTSSPALPPETTYTRREIDRLLAAAAGAADDAPFVITSAEASLTGAFNLGSLTTGVLKITVSGGSATPSTAIAGIDYLAPGGSGASLTNLNAGNLASGTVPDARFPSVLPAISGLNLTNLNAGNLSTGTLPDARFPSVLPAISGLNLTNLNAGNLGSGTLPDARFPSTLPALSGVNLTNLNAGNLASGTVPDARFPATLPAISGVNLTNLNAGNLASGTVPAARFPALTGEVTSTVGTVATTIANNVVTDAKFRQSAGLSVVGRSASATGNVADITAGSDFQVFRRSGTAIGFGSIDLSQSAAVGSSILGLANGGTGSATKNFIDLTTNQDPIAGNKRLTGITTLGIGTYYPASPSLVFSPTTLLVADSGDPAGTPTPGTPSTLLAPTAAFETWRTGNGTTYGYTFSLRKSAGEGEIYNVFVDTLWNPSMTGFLTDVNHVNLRSDLFMLPTNNNNSRQIVGYGAWLRAGRGMPAGGAQALDVANMRAVGAQIDAWNNSSVQADFDAATINSTIGLAINTEPGKHNSVAIYLQAASAASSYSVGILPSPNSLYRYGIDMSSMTFQFTGNVGSTTNTINGTGTIFDTEAVIGDQVKMSGSATWFTVTGIAVGGLSLTVTPNPGSTAGGQFLIKKVNPLRLSNQSFITAQGFNQSSNYRLIGLKADDTWSFDPDGRTSSFGGDVIVYNNANTVSTNKITLKSFFDGVSAYYPGIWFGSATPTLSNFAFLADGGITVLNGSSIDLRISNQSAWGINASKHFVAGLDNSYDIGASGATRPRTGYFGTSVQTPLLATVLDNSSTSTVDNLLILTHTSTGTPANGLGAGVLFQLESSTGATRDVGNISTIWTDVSDGTRKSAMTFQTVNATTTVESLRLDYTNGNSFNASGTAAFFTRTLTTGLGTVQGAAQFGTAGFNSIPGDGASMLFFTPDNGGIKALAGRVSAVAETSFGGALAAPCIAGLTCGYSGALVLSVRADANDSTAITEALRLTAATNAKIAGSAVRGTTEGTKQLVLFNGTAPVGTLANGVSIYSSAGNLVTMNAAGDAVPLSAGKAGRVTAQTGAAASVASFTVGASDASFEVSANVLVTTATTHAFTVTCTYTDEGNTSRTLTLPFTLVAGGAIVTSVVNSNGAVPYMGIRQHIRCKSGTTITIATTGAFTSVAYNAEGVIRQLN